MTDQELVDYFANTKLPDILRINRAITQFEVKDAVDRNIECCETAIKAVMPNTV